MTEPQERRGVIREDAETPQGSEPGCHHSGDDQKEGEEQARTAAPHTGDFWEEVSKQNLIDHIPLANDDNAIF